MGAGLTGLLPLEGIKILLVLFLSFLIGLEREEHRASDGEAAQWYAFGGVRTFPLIGLTGYALALLSGSALGPVTAGFVVIGAFLWLSYRHKLQKEQYAGATTEVSGLLTYLIGALVSHGEFWIATTLAIIAILLLELKEALENLSRRVPSEDILTFTKFLLLTAVILPVVPNRNFGSFGFNPFRAWLVIVAASSISYGSYLLQRWSKLHGSILISAVLGGLYSSTATAVVLAKRSRESGASQIYAGGILMASGVMYLRVLVLVGLFNRALMMRLLPHFTVLGAAGLLGGWLWSLRHGGQGDADQKELPAKNPLQLSAAFIFGVLFVALLAATHYAIVYLGRGGVYGLAALTGLSDIDPFILGMAQSAGGATPLALAAGGITVAAASNNLVNGVYAFSFGDRKTGVPALALMVSLAILAVLLLVI